MIFGWLNVGVANSVLAPEGFTLPILAMPASENQRLPSGPVVMATGALPNVSVNSVMVPEGVTLPILPAGCSENQRLPSGPVVMNHGWSPVGVANSVMVPEGVFTVSSACADVRPVALAVIV